MYVDFARKLAAAGIASLRMDIAGLGDSPAPPGRDENQLYAGESLADVSAGLEWLRARGYADRILVGHCAGAYLGFYTAVQDEAATGLVMLNPQRFFWRPGDSLEVAMRSSYHATGWYLQRVLKSEIWGRAIRGDINLRGIGGELSRRTLKRLRGRAAEVMGRMSGRENNSQKVVRWFRGLARRRTRVMLVYSAEDGGLDEIFLHAGRNARKITRLGNVQLRILDGADHNLTPRNARDDYFSLLEGFLQSGS
jgi:pimeloyl-ACP methyl ester carboxylesterase